MLMVPSINAVEMTVRTHHIAMFDELSQAREDLGVMSESASQPDFANGLADRRTFPCDQTP